MDKVDANIRNNVQDDLDENLNIFHRKWAGSLPVVRGIDEPEIVLDRLNNLCIQAYDSIRVRKSKAYRIGRFLFLPLFY